MENPQVYMSESEIQTIISSFRSALQMYVNEVEKLQTKNEALQTDIQGEIIKSTGLQEELKLLQHKSQENLVVLESYNEKINLIEAGLRSSLLESSHEDSFYKENLRLFSQTADESNKAKMAEVLMGLIGKIKALESKKITLKQSTEELQDVLEKLNSGEKVFKICLNCKKEFIPKQNKDGDCVYHSGRLKYYSCKGCGDDSYYNCCSKCMKCSEGCRKGRHIPL